MCIYIFYKNQNSSALTFSSLDLNEFLPHLLSEAETFHQWVYFIVFFFSSSLLSTYCVPDTVLGSRGTTVNKNARGPYHHGGYRLLGETGESITANTWKIATTNVTGKETYRCCESMCKRSYGWRLYGDFRNKKLAREWEQRDVVEAWLGMSLDTRWACLKQGSECATGFQRHSEEAVMFGVIC